MALLVTMVIVPLAVVWVGSSLVHALDRLESLTAGAATAAVDAATAPKAGAGATEGLRVRVLDGAGNPVSGASVRLVSRRVPFRLLREGATDVTGRFVFARGEAEVVRVIASRDGVGVVTSGEVSTSGQAGMDVDLVLSGDGVVRGKVVDTNGKPVGGATLALDGIPWALPGVVTGDDGAFSVVTAPDEATAIVAVARGYRPGRASLEGRAALAASGQREAVDLAIVLAAASPVPGTVEDAEGKPIAARVVACEHEAAEAQVASANDGTFELPPSTIGCAAFAVQAEYGASATATVLEGARLALRLTSGGGIEGVVVDGRGSAVEAFTVGIESFSAARGSGLRNDLRQRIDDRRGAFSFDRLAPGTYVLTASAPGKPPTRSDPVAVTGGAKASVRIVLEAGGVVVGHVYDGDHKAVSGVRLAFDQVSSAVLSHASATTDDAGAFRLEGAPSGPFSLRAEKAGYRVRLIAGLRVASGATVEQDVALSPGGGGANLELGGIGATVERGATGVVFHTVFPGDPASRAGLQDGDAVLRIDGEPTDGMSLADALQRLRGEPGSTVGITVRRAGQSGGAPETLDFVVVRAVVVR